MTQPLVNLIGAVYKWLFGILWLENSDWYGIYGGGDAMEQRDAHGTNVLESDRGSLSPRTRMQRQWDESAICGRKAHACMQDDRSLRSSRLH